MSCMCVCAVACRVLTKLVVSSVRTAVSGVPPPYCQYFDSLVDFRAEEELRGAGDGLQ